MTSHVDQSPSIAEIIESVKRLGYGASQNIRLYGEEFDSGEQTAPTCENACLQTTVPPLALFSQQEDGKCHALP